MSIIPSPWTVGHIPRSVDTTQQDDHGNNPIVDGPPELKKVMSLTQLGRMGRGSSREIIHADVLLRVETSLIMAVADPESYHTEDLVYVWPEVDDSGNWLLAPDGNPSGTAFWVDGEAQDDRDGPWPGLLKVFGGVVKLRRVT